ncbi:MAG: sec-independent protein translocase protein TatA [Patiriisocius sp.]|jgi:sec-independent protein translocase protein TatA
MLLFFNIGTSELLVVFIFYLLFFGAKNIPSMARFLGRTSRQVKDATNEIKREFSDSAKDMKKEIDEHKNTLDQLDSEL